MKDLILNDKTRAAIEIYLNQPTHALLLCGQTGVGLGTIANKLARTVAGANIVRLAPKLHKGQKTANINVDDIKELNKIAYLRSGEPLAMIIDEAEQMTHQTPEAFLKLLEEPGANIRFIMTTHAPDKLPATILSRVQKIEVLPTNKRICKSLTDTIKIATKRQQIEFLAGGLPAEIKRLVNDDLYFRERAQSFATAKAFLGGKTYERLQQTAKIKTRAEAIEFVESLARLTTILAGESSAVNNLLLISDVLDNLAQNGSVKAQLSYLATNMV